MHQINIVNLWNQQQHTQQIVYAYVLGHTAYTLFAFSRSRRKISISSVFQNVKIFFQSTICNKEDVQTCDLISSSEYN